MKETIRQREQEIAELLEKQKGMEQNQREKLLDQHKANIDAFEEALELERKRQDKILNERIKKCEQERLAEEQRRLQQKIEEKTTGRTARTGRCQIPRSKMEPPEPYSC